MTHNAERAAGQGSPIATPMLRKPSDTAITTVQIQATTPVSEPGFDYGQLAPDIADALRSQASRIRTLVRNTTAIIIEIGNDLLAVKEAIDHGKFGAWIEAECGFSIRTAENYIRAAEFAEGKNETIALLNPATVYRLAAKSTPAEIVSDVISRTERGEVVSDGDVVAALERVRVQRRQAAVAAKNATRRATSKRRNAKWEKQRLAQQQLDDMLAQQRREVVAGLVDAIGLNNARLVVEALTQGDLWEMFDELKRACNPENDEG